MSKIDKRKLYNYISKIKYELRTPAKEKKRIAGEQSLRQVSEDEVQREQKQAKKQAEEYLRKSTEVTYQALPASACTGCGACAAVCPEGAVTMEEDAEGFYSPVFHAERCTSCGKCKQACPQLYPEFQKKAAQSYYAAQAEGENRKKSTAGGFFVTAAQYFMREGGYVCAAVTAAKGKRTKHYISNDPAFAIRYGKAKYMQSNMGDCFPQMKKLLEENKAVLFAGCPCQVAGLKKYLGREYEGLLTIDLACKGVPSPGSFDKYYIDTFGREPSRIDFHNKAVFGLSGEGMYLVTADGEEYVSDESRDPFFRSYHAGLNVRKSCGSCIYAIHARVGDLTLATLHNIRQFNQEWDNGLAMSLVGVNTSRGLTFMQKLQPDFKVLEQVAEAKVHKFSPIVARPYYCNERDRFFELLKQTYFLKALNYAQQDRYDVAVLGLWFGRNYGSMITYYALHQVLEKMGLSVLMISNALMPEYEDTTTKTHPVRFAREHYHISRQLPLNQLWQLNRQADSFLVGSDQLWNHWLSRPYGQAYYLEFVDDYNKKIAYGTSFGGKKYNGPDGQRRLVQSNLQKFDYVSVREDYAVGTCKETFDVEAVKVLDPVFLCERSEYDTLLESMPQIEQEAPYILAYILNPDEEIGEMLTKLQEKYQRNVRIILDEPPWLFDDNRSALKLQENDKIKVLKNIEVREWLYYIKHADYVVTDSFHGTCFSIIFERRFMTMVNKKRARERFPALLEPLKLMNHLVEEPEELLEGRLLEQEIDYKQVFAQIDQEKAESRTWLHHAIYSEKQVDMDKAYPRLENVRKVNS